MVDKTTPPFESITAGSGNFHTHSNLTQTLNKIISEHYKSAHRTEENPHPLLPDFMSEAVHMIVNNLAAAANGTPYYKGHWQNIAVYAQAVVAILDKTEREQQAALELAKKQAEEEQQNNKESNEEQQKENSDV